MSTHYNNVAQAVSGTPGTGTITLGAAVTGSQTLGAAAGGNATVDVFITDGSAWEVARNCTYTHSGTTLTRGTLEASSTGAVLSLTSAAVVRVAATADSGRRWDAAALEHVTGPDAATTLAVNTLAVVDLSGWAANRTYTLPATAAVGDRVGVLVQTGSAIRRVAITAASGGTLSGVPGGTVQQRLMVSGEVQIMRCVSANTAWVVEASALNPLYVHVRNDGTTVQTHTGGTQTLQITTALTTVVSDPAGCWDNVNKRFQPPRPGLYQIACGTQFNSSANSRTQAFVFLNGSSDTPGSLFPPMANAFPTTAGPVRFNGAADFSDMRVYSDSAVTTLPAPSSVYFKAFYVGP